MKTLSFNRITLAAVAVLFVIFVFTSCQKENSLSTSTSAVSEEEAANLSDESTQAAASFDDVEDVSFTAAEEEGEAAVFGRSDNTSDRRYQPSFPELRLRIGSCATVTVSPNDSTYPKTVTIDFGDGCIGADGKFRKGAIIIHLTGPIRRSGSVMTITFRNFFLNRAHMEGTKTLSNLSENGNIKFAEQVTGGAVTFPNGRGYQFQSLKYVRQFEGGSTRSIRDDVFSIEGRSETQFNNGKTVIFNTETPLIKKVACHWISNGVLKVKVNEQVLYVDYGAPSTGECDNKALLTWNNGNNQRLITLP